jgi:hypothetical protein
MTQFCCDDKARRTLIEEQSSLNGIDFIEVQNIPEAPIENSQRFLEVHFLKPLDDHISISKENVLIEGGERIRDLAVSDIHPSKENPSRWLTVEVDRPGDFSTYTLRLVRSDEDPRPLAGFDPILSQIKFSFKAGCPSDLDYRQEVVCPVESVPPMDINYLAKDYASFRQIILDRISCLVPEWKERNASDQGIALVEILAYVGDYLSYSQDAIATEAYLGTARRRVSVRRHARLVDYFMHDGSNARTWVHIDLEAGQDSHSLVLHREEIRFLTRLPGFPPYPPYVSQEEMEKASDLHVEVFEPMHDIELFPEQNMMNFYTWGSGHCCLAAGSTKATLEGRYVRLKAGDVLIFKEERGPKSGREADADPTHRHAVRLTKVTFDETDYQGNLIPLRDPSIEDREALITEIEWNAEDALPFPLCLSTPQSRYTSIALGNNLLVDHGQRIISDQPPTEEEMQKMNLPLLQDPGLKRENLERLGTMPRKRIFRIPLKEVTICERPGRIAAPPRFRPRLKTGPLTQAAGKITGKGIFEPFNPQGPASSAFSWDMRDTIPVVTILDSEGKIWSPRRDLLSGGENIFVAEVEDDGTACIRFGDGVFGARPTEGSELFATYRIGNGTSGNIGADSLAYVITDVKGIKAISNPLPARGGREPEEIEDVRQRAPVAFRSQERAVTPEDYEARAQMYPGVQKAAATFRWTGSWNTVFLTVDRLEGKRVDPEFEAGLRSYLERYRLTGHDLEIDDPRSVPLEIEMEVTVHPGYSRSSVKEALLEVFSNRNLSDGRKGLFHPDKFTFGQSVFLSPLYRGAQGTPGVASVRISKFQRQGIPSDEPLNNGELKMNRLEIARLDNDSNFPDRGLLRITMEGGRW